MLILLFLSDLFSQRVCSPSNLRQLKVWRFPKTRIYAQLSKTGLLWSSCYTILERFQSQSQHLLLLVADLRDFSLCTLRSLCHGTCSHLTRLLEDHSWMGSSIPFPIHRRPGFRIQNAYLDLRSCPQHLPYFLKRLLRSLFCEVNRLTQNRQVRGSLTLGFFDLRSKAKPWRILTDLDRRTFGQLLREHHWLNFLIYEQVK